MIHHDEHLSIYQGDWVEVLRTLPDESVHCVVTSPPYWGLRDYGTGTWLGGDIVSSGNGYRYAETAEEMQDCARRLRERAIHQLLTARALRRAAREWQTVEMVLGL